MLHTYTVQLEWPDGRVLEVHTVARNCSTAATEAATLWSWLAGAELTVTTVRRLRPDPVQAAIERYETYL